MTDNFQMQMKPVNNAKEAQWIADSLEKPWSRSKDANYAAAIIPRGFEAYARLFHPAYYRSEECEITWSEVAKHTGWTPHSQMQWHAIADFNNQDICLSGLIAPYTGRLPEKQAKILIEILCKYTSTKENCYFAIWDGWNLPDLEKLRDITVRLQLTDRCYYLVEADIGTAVNQITSLPLKAAGMWWPKDRAWCVATEVDMMWTYIGGTGACISEILANNKLEAWKATTDDRADINGDRINANGKTQPYKCNRINTTE